MELNYCPKGPVLKVIFIHKIKIQNYKIFGVVRAGEACIKLSFRDHNILTTDTEFKNAN